MRRAALVTTLVTTFATLVLASAVSASTMPFQASFQEFFGKSTAHPCQGGFACGTGTVAGFGKATSTFNVLDFSGFDPETGCGTGTFERVITLSDGSTLTLIETGTVCGPGNAALAPGAARSFGNPTFLNASFTVVGGTGVFEGLTGSGTTTSRLAGESGHTSLSGTLDP
jgi:hypothetical protein